jgi:protein-serine/threonine kinase
MIRDPNASKDARHQEGEVLAKKESNFLRFLRTKEAPSNFQTIKVIGKGAFGEVKLVQRKTDGKIYALKSLIKTEMFKKDQLAHVRAERDILADSKDNPWLVKLHASFQDSAYLYLLMEFLPGGDLMTMLIKYEIFSEDITRFYMAEIVMAIEAVHKLGFLHRWVSISHGTISIFTCIMNLKVLHTDGDQFLVILSLTISFSIVVVTLSLLISVSQLVARRLTTTHTIRIF